MNKIKRTIFIFLTLVLASLGFYYKNQIKTYITQYTQKTETTQEKSVKPSEEDEKISYINVVPGVAMPQNEALEASGVASRQSIKIVTEGFKIIDFIVGKDTTEVKKGDILIKYEKKGLELKKEDLQNSIDVRENTLARYKNLEQHQMISKDDLEKIKVELIELQGKLNSINYDIEKSIIIAPFDCFVKHHGHTNGSYLQNGQEVLTIFCKDKLFVDLSVNLKDMRELENSNLLGRNTTLKFSNNRKLKGKVIYVLNNADPFTAAVNVSIEIDDKKNKVTAGEICHVKIYTGICKRFIIVPEISICGEDHDKYVFVIRNNIAYQTPITIKGKYKKEKGSFFVEGVNPGDIIVTYGANRLTNLTKVEIKK